MNPILWRRWLPLSIAVFIAVASHGRAHDVTPEMVEAANNFLTALTPEQQTKTVYEVKADERLNWDFVPRDRKGLPFKEMNSAQKRLAQVLLSSGLSHRGYAKAETIMSLDQVLYDMENQSPRRDPDLYYVTIFGKPSATEPWGWRVEGHHLSVNFTVISEKVITTSPLFFGSNPAEIRQGPRQGLRVLGREEDLARQLLRSLTDEQKKVAIYTNIAPGDIITGKARKVSALSPDGLASAAMKPEQRKMLRAVVEEFARRIRTELADEDLNKIEAAGWDKVSFAWAGGLEPGQKHYYRVQGPTFLLEYDNTQNNANHVHSVWRDLKNDFGGDLLREHYEKVPHPKDTP